MSNHIVKINVNPEQGDMPSAILRGISNAPKLVQDAIQPYVENLLNVPIAEPAGGSGNLYGINVTKDFPWTKTRNIKQFEEKVPEIYLQEYYVASGSTIANLNKIVSVFNNVGAATGAAASAFVDRIPSGIDPLIDNSKSFLNLFFSNNEQDDPEATKKNIFKLGWDVPEEAVKGIPVSKKYLKVYENLYGVIETGFKYKIPFFNNDWKSINNNWTNDPLITTITKGSIGSTVEDLAKGLTTGFGVDFAKIYDYKDTGPAQSFEIILDNSFDSSIYSGGLPTYQKNWELIFLLCFQNLPSKTTRFLVSPPVIYKASVEGVFSYLYSFISKLKVECIGNRQFKNVDLRTTEGTVSTKTLIPEAYKVSIELQSLIPETKNLFFSSYNGVNLSTRIESPTNINTPEVINKRSAIFPDGL
jgi:hypothetical protein